MSIRKIRKHVYKIEVEKTIDGSRIRKSKTVTSQLTGKELRYFLLKSEQALLKSITPNDRYSGISYEQFVKEFIDSLNVEIRSIHYYKDFLYGRSLNYFKGKKIASITRSDVHKFIINLQRVTSSRTGKPLSPKTIKHYRDSLRALFNHAVFLEIINKNPVDGIKIDPVPNQVEGRYYEPEEVEVILKTLKKYGEFKYYVFFALQLYTGCRPSEIYGLMWDRLDFENKTITIDQALVLSRESEGYVLKKTKTGERRVKPLPDELAKLLKQLPKRSKFVFTNENGRFLEQNAFRRYLRNFCEDHNLKYLPPYAIRHTTGTLLSAKGIPMVNIAKSLGHTNTQTTSKYVHATKKIDDEANELLSGYISSRDSVGIQSGNNN